MCGKHTVILPSAYLSSVQTMFWDWCSLVATQLNKVMMDLFAPAFSLSLSCLFHFHVVAITHFFITFSASLLNSIYPMALKWSKNHSVDTHDFAPKTHSHIVDRTPTLNPLFFKFQVFTFLIFWISRTIEMICMLSLFLYLFPSCSGVIARSVIVIYDELQSDQSSIRF